MLVCPKIAFQHFFKFFHRSLEFIVLSYRTMAILYLLFPSVWFSLLISCVHWFGVAPFASIDPNIHYSGPHFLLLPKSVPAHPKVLTFLAARCRVYSANSLVVWQLFFRNALPGTYFSYFINSKGRLHSVCRLVSVYALNIHESIARRFYNPKGVGIYWDC